MATRLLSSDRQQSVFGALPSAVNSYSPYGVIKASPVPALAFCGQYRDPLTGGYPLGNGHRFYSPTLMRFIAPDALSPFSRGGINGYVYCGADPVNRLDPSGAYWLSVLLRAVGLASSGATLFGATIRTMRNVVGRRSAMHAIAGSMGQTQSPGVGSTTTTPSLHKDLDPLSRVSNQQFAMTGFFGVAGQIAAAASGVSPNMQTLTDVFAVGNTVTNLSGGSIGNFAAAREVFGYLRGNPHEIASVVWETLMDLTMVDEMLSAVGRGVVGAARRIRSPRPAAPHEVQV
ncbi:MULTISPECIES: RHS repeat-associated core domain-containing protein [Pseudomonas]|uniref:RHS repeat-associated core domain-containing protein n=1 Tax=Pseudomonas TaxID=286 RepID=UPI002DB94D44|nr:RHS repeat-associated core domain-containing protein [Pseudomonas asiatica]MEB6588629.1 RHS repeat-associated core domain-containing protein [Pseudomonas asiatica]